MDEAKKRKRPKKKADGTMGEEGGEDGADGRRWRGAIALYRIAPHCTAKAPAGKGIGSSEG